MNHKLEFEKLVSYDSGRSGISVNVELRLDKNKTTFEAKIDTGSTYCIFERIHGERLGIEIEKGLREKIITASGSFWAFAYQLTLAVEGYEFDSTVYFAQDESFHVNVLGRHGWLDRVIIGINDYDGKLYLSRYENE
ncbi:MAG TPA: aspartyl protease family protein [Pyrinomonadaceae bacterium]|nr:aspartyl protease family protein [Pyrinomonadaceae bacterium]